jgi:hypothetical protein
MNAGRRAGVRLLYPLVAIPFPGVVQPALGVAAEQDDALPSAIERHRVTKTRRRTGIGNLRPVLAVPLPCVAEQQASAASAKKYRSTARAIEGHCVVNAPAGTDVLHLRPAVAVPFPGIAEQHVVERIAAEQYDASEADLSSSPSVLALHSLCERIQRPLLDRSLRDEASSHQRCRSGWPGTRRELRSSRYQAESGKAHWAPPAAGWMSSS